MMLYGVRWRPKVESGPLENRQRKRLRHDDTTRQRNGQGPTSLGGSGDTGPNGRR